MQDAIANKNAPRRTRNIYRPRRRGGVLPRPRGRHFRFYETYRQIRFCPTGGVEPLPYDKFGGFMRVHIGAFQFARSFRAGGASPSPTLRRRTRALIIHSSSFIKKAPLSGSFFLSSISDRAADALGGAVERCDGWEQALLGEEAHAADGVGDAAAYVADGDGD